MYRTSNIQFKTFQMLFPGDGGVVPFEGSTGSPWSDSGLHRRFPRADESRPPSGDAGRKKHWENTEVFFADEWKFYQHSQRLTHTELPNSF